MHKKLVQILLDKRLQNSSSKTIFLEQNLFNLSGTSTKFIKSPCFIYLSMTIDDSCDVNGMTQLVQTHVSGANMAGDHGNELRYTLPLDGVNQFAG